MTLREKIEVMEAFERGEEVECRYSGSKDWFALTGENPEFRWEGDNYRIKPKPKQTVVIEKWLLNMQGTKQYAIEEGSKEEMETWGRNETDAWQKVKLLDTYEVTL